MKYTPFKYQGGKTTMVPIILQNLPKTCSISIEGFIGGGSLFWYNDNPLKNQVINDISPDLYNWYITVKNEYELLNYAIQKTVYSRELYEKCLFIRNKPSLFSNVERAVATYIIYNQGFAGAGHKWGFDRDKDSTSSTFYRRKKEFATGIYQKKIKDTTIENMNILLLIQKYDSKDSFFYLDPPYVNSDMGSYDGYSLKDYTSLLELLTKIKGKFMLSNYNSKLLTSYCEKHDWALSSHEKSLVISNNGLKNGTNTARKIEVLVTNY